MDGGIKVENSGIVRENGANVIVSGTGIFNHPNPTEAILSIRGSNN